jgi:hypothetical protein
MRGLGPSLGHHLPWTPGGGVVPSTPVSGPQLMSVETLQYAVVPFDVAVSRSTIS